MAETELGIARSSRLSPPSPGGHSHHHKLAYKNAGTRRDVDRRVAKVLPTSDADTPRVYGEPRDLPLHFLGSAFQSNSYFARRLLVVMLFILVLDLGGIATFWLTDDLRRGGLHVDSSMFVSLGFKDITCASDISSECTDCGAIVTYSTFVFHLMPGVALLGLPASGIRAFEPFKREQRSGPINKIQRTVFMQACELVATMMLLLNGLIMVYFIFTLLQGDSFDCDQLRVRVYTAVSVVAYGAMFLELTYFARFREHLKMQLGAFLESDQTGAIRSRLSQRCCIQKSRDKLEKEIRLLRKRLHAATELDSADEVARALHDMQNLLGVGFAEAFYSDATLVLGMFAKSKRNPMHVAAHQGNIAILEQLLRAGFKVNAYDKTSRVRFTTGDLFWYAAQFLVAKPPDTGDDSAVSLLKTTLSTPLFCAVSTGQTQAVKWLIDHGADVNRRCLSSYSSERIPPLFAADSPEIVAMLLQAGANHLDVPDPGHMNTFTVLQLAYMRGNCPVASELEAWGGDVALTPLHTLAAKNEVNAVRRLLRKGVDPNTLGEHGYVGFNRRTPLHWAAVNGATDAVRALLEAGADPNFQDDQGRSPLHWAARMNREGVVHLLLKYQADPSLLDDEGMTPVLCAALAADANKGIFDELVRHGASVNDTMANGDTPLHVAMKKENRETALTLLACGADIMKTNNDGLRAVDCTTSSKLQFDVKRAAGTRDVMISYTHTHAEFAIKLRESLEAANVTTWLDQMDPTGIGGGSVWREEIARGIRNAAVVVCVLTEDYSQSEWCLKELALAKECGTPIMAVSTEHTRITDDLQLYLYTRQMVPFEPAISCVNNENPRHITYQYDAAKFAAQFRLLLDGVRDEIEKHRNKLIATRTRKRSKRDNDDDEDRTDTDTAPGLDLAAMGDDFVFLAHGDYHRTFVQRVYERLNEAGISCFLDGAARALHVDMAARIRVAKDAILQCACFIVVISSHTIASEIVRDQMAFAEDKGRPIVPLLLNELELTPDAQYTLSRTKLQHFTPEFGFNASFLAMLGTVREHVRRGSAVDTVDSRGLGPPRKSRRTQRLAIVTSDLGHHTPKSGRKSALSSPARSHAQTS